MKVFIDADGCPVVDHTLRIAQRYHVEVIILCDTSHVFERDGVHVITVSQGADSVDFQLVNRVRPGDVVVTQDYGLAAMCLARKVYPIHQDGMLYTDKNIDALLLQRYTAQKIRRAGGRTKGPHRRSSAQNREYEQALDRLLCKLVTKEKEESDMEMQEKIQKTMHALEKNNMQAYYVPSKEAVAAKVAELLHDGDVVSNGGSVTLQETGVMDLLRSGRYRYLDRDQPGLTREQVEEIYRKAFYADAYLCSSNAVTVNGELYNVDGNSNRTSAILYGPKSVIMVVGCNKIVDNLEEAVRRVKTVAAPMNTKRLGCETYCKEKGECVSLTQQGAEMPSGCASDGRICCNFVVSAQQRHVGRIKVILVGESLGY